MKSSDRSWVWILDEDSDFRTLMAALAPRFRLQVFDFSDFEEAESAFLYYQEHVRKYPSTHCLLAVVVSSPSRKSGIDDVKQWLATIRRVFPDVKTIQLGQQRPKSISDLFRLFESLF
jgi:hypothetical protein